jgi:hypothetical protein
VFGLTISAYSHKGTAALTGAKVSFFWKYYIFYPKVVKFIATRFKNVIFQAKRLLFMNDFSHHQGIAYFDSCPINPNEY